MNYVWLEKNALNIFIVDYSPFWLDDVFVVLKLNSQWWKNYWKFKLTDKNIFSQKYTQVCTSVFKFTRFESKKKKERNYLMNILYMLFFSIVHWLNLNELKSQSNVQEPILLMSIKAESGCASKGETFPFLLWPSGLRCIANTLQ